MANHAALPERRSGSGKAEHVRRRLVQGFTLVVRLVQHPSWAAARIQNYLYKLQDRFRSKAWQGSDGLSVQEVLSKVIPTLDATTVVAQAPKVETPASTGIYGRQDGSSELVNFVYAYCRLSKPELVAETGVANGFSTAAILQALADNQKGALVSIDLPQLSPGAAKHIGKAVPQNLRDRWTLHLGPASRMIRRVLPHDRKLDLFVQDAAHTVKGQLAEFKAAWPFLRDGGLLVVDDVTEALEAFASEVGRTAIYLAQPAKPTPIGILMR
jgi:predicted O-methyltransferase YrrM